MKKPPVSQVKDGFQSKEKLVEAVKKLATKDLWLDRTNDVKGLRRVANAKLLRLHALLTDAKARFGSRTKLIDAIAELEKRSKDAGYRNRLQRFPLPQLLDRHAAATRRAAKKPVAAATKGSRPTSAKKDAAKKAPAKKAPASPAKTKGAAKA